MTPGARVAAAISILDQVLDGTAAEAALTGWARGSRFAGSKDRAAVRDLVFDALRARRSLAARGGAMTGRGLMIGLALRDDLGLDALFDGAGHAPAPLNDAERAQSGDATPLPDPVAHDMPDWLWPLWCDSLGDDASAAALAQQARAPVFLRINRRRGDSRTVIAALADDDVTAVPHPTVPGCLEVTGNARRIGQSRAYTDGLVELQDASSQLAIQAVPVESGARVLDYCAGGGGKALGFADQHDAAVFAHDIAPERMRDLPARAARAGVTITQLRTDALARQAPFDVVFCDAPCSGSGTWRRTPDAKWRLAADDLDRLCATQAEVIRAAAPLVAPGGVLAYATCSVLRSENDGIVDDFLVANPGWRRDRTERLYPGAAGDGFFLSVLRDV